MSNPVERIREIVEIERFLKVLRDRHARLMSGPENAETVAELDQVQKQISDLVGRKERLLSEEVAESKQRPPHVGTIGSSIRVGHSITVNCGNPDCLHRSTIDPEKLRDRYGNEYLISDLVARSVCSECGARWPNISLTVSPVSSPQDVTSPP